MTGGSPVVRVAVAHFSPTVAAVPDVRASTVRTLAGWSVDPDALDAAELIVDELAANAVEASSADDFVAVRLTATNGKVLIEVWDRNESGPRLTHATDDCEHGRGLLLVDAIATAWSWYRAKSGGKVVWAQIPCLMRSEPAGTGTAMPTRTPSVAPVPRVPKVPVVYSTDPEILRRVADSLRALDAWHEPGPAEAVPSGAPAHP